jgi:hypothetical protein
MRGRYLVLYASQVQAAVTSQFQNLLQTEGSDLLHVVARDARAAARSRIKGQVGFVFRVTALSEPDLRPHSSSFNFRLRSIVLVKFIRQTKKWLQSQRGLIRLLDRIAGLILNIRANKVCIWPGFFWTFLLEGSEHTPFLLKVLT